MADNIPSFTRIALRYKNLDAFAKKVFNKTHGREGIARNDEGTSGERAVFHNECRRRAALRIHDRGVAYFRRIPTPSY